MEMSHKKRKIKTSRVWPFGLCFLITNLQVLWHWLWKKEWDVTTWAHNFRKNSFVLQLSCFSKQSVWLQWGMRRGPTRGIHPEKVGLRLHHSTSGNPVGTWQTCCHQLSLQKSSPPLGQRGRKVPASPTSQHMMEETGGCTHCLPSLPLPARDGGKGRAHPPSPFSTSSTTRRWTLSHKTPTRPLDPCSKEKQGGWWR